MDGQKRRMKVKISAIAAAMVMLLVGSCGAVSAQENTGIQKYAPINIGALGLRRSPNITYEIDPQREAYFVWTPPGFSAATASQYGVIAYISSAEEVRDLPPGWEQVLARRRYIFVAPQRSGNGNGFERRSGLAVQAACQMLSKYRLDRRRIFVGGISGGARSACYAAFNQPDLFGGTIQDCGCEYYERVPSKYRTTDLDTAGKYYGDALPRQGMDLSAVRGRVKFAVVTGGGDFRRGNILDIYHGGLVPGGYKCRLWDVPDMGHTDCSTATLEQVLGWLEG